MMQQSLAARHTVLTMEPNKKCPVSAGRSKLSEAAVQ
jgi:hypothetical protein